MIPAGYMLKRVASKPDWLGAANVRDVLSISGHVSHDFADFIHHWKHNGYWLFNSPRDMDALLALERLERAGFALLYFEIFEMEFVEATKTWSTFGPEASLATQVEKPEGARLEGFDVATFSCGASPECSPLSCNSLAKDLPVNEHCLFASFEEAKAALESGKFDNSEPGPFRIFAVYSILG